MFTGLVESKTQILEILHEPGGIRLVVSRPPEFDDVRLGDSIAINGCCLTVVALDPQSMAFQAGQETLSRTNIGIRSIDDFVNCERSLCLGQRIGGHLVTGHIDGVGQLMSLDTVDGWCRMRIRVPMRLIRQMASKGCITMDGVSLTLVDVEGDSFTVALIPHTLAVTTLGNLRVNDQVNIETDLLAKYVEQQMLCGQPATSAQPLA